MTTAATPTTAGVDLWTDEAPGLAGLAAAVQGLVALGLTQVPALVVSDTRARWWSRGPWADGTTHVVFHPVEFLLRLAVLVPRRART